MQMGPFLHTPTHLGPFFTRAVLLWAVLSASRCKLGGDGSFNKQIIYVPLHVESIQLQEGFVYKIIIAYIYVTSHTFDISRSNRAIFLKQKSSISSSQKVYCR